MAVITGNGIELETIEEITIDNTELWTEKTGETNVSASSASGELIAITSEMQVRNEQLVADAFTQNMIRSATENNLENIAEIKNQKRIVNKKTVVYISFTGIDSTVIPIGTSFKSTFNDEEFLSDYEIIIASGIAFVSAGSVNIGVSCPSSTITLPTPIVGVSTVTNNTPAIVGFVEESDSILRTRLQTIGTPFTFNLKEGLFLALSELTTVSKVKILDNNTDVAIDGVPARHFSTVVIGGNNAEIADIVYKFMGVGNPSFGDVVQSTKSLITGDIYSVQFNRPIELLTVIAVTLSTNSDFNVSTGFGEVEENIINFVENLKIGEDLIVQQIESVCLIQGVLGVSVLLNGASVNLFSTFKELFVTNNANVTVS